jgi:sugar/nucleoside kinase (ribokinase family)
MEILVVGTVAFDAIETPFGKIEKIEGGAANYISLSASFFTNRINLISVIGDDFPQDYLDILQNRGVNLEGLQVMKGKNSFFWSGKYHLDMNTRDTLATELNVLADFKPKVPESYQNSEVIMLGNLTPQVQQQVLAQLKKKPKLVVLDTMNFWMETEMDNLLEVLKYVDVLTINDEEARLLSNEYSLIKAAKKIFKLGPKYLIIKKGEHGALLFHENKVFFAPALPLEDVFDPTGAGDTFAGGFVGHLTQSGNFSFNNMKNAVIYGSAMASFTVEKFGPSRLLEITNGEINNRVQEFIDLIQFDFSLINGQ